MKKSMFTGYRPTWCEVDLKALEYNLGRVREVIPEQTKVLVCVKSDAYGHGLIPVSRKLAGLRVDYLGVASIDEGIALRQAGINTPILVLGMVLPSHILPILKYNLTQTVCSEELAVALDGKAKDYRRTVNIHIKIDTGMGRLGVLCKDAPAFIKKIKRLRFLNIEGMFTHFPCAEKDPSFTRRQVKLFEGLIARLRQDNIFIPLCHAANSMAVIAYPRSHLNLVRPGLMVYGLYPREDIKMRLKPVMSLKSKIIYFKRVPANTGISYGHTYRTKKQATIAILPIGYGDGYPRNLSGKADVIIRKKRFKISGNICMDQVLVDVGDLDVRTGDEAVLIGRQGRQRVSAEELARLSGTIPYEIVCGIGNRVPRVYKD